MEPSRFTNYRCQTATSYLINFISADIENKIIKAFQFIIQFINISEQQLAHRDHVILV